MDETEFDKFAEEYQRLHSANIRISGEGPEYFAEYKVRDAASILASAGFSVRNLDVLDFGAGVGNSVPYFRSHLPGCRLTCLDVSKKSLHLGAVRHRGTAEFVHFDGVVVPFPKDRFDLVFLACVLHHIPQREHETILAELHRVLRPEGHLIVFEHNPYNPLTVHAVNTCPFDENAVLLKPRMLATSIANVGFERAAIAYRIFFPRALASMRRFEAWIKWLPLGGQYCVHARKA